MNLEDIEITERDFAAYERWLYHPDMRLVEAFALYRKELEDE